MLKERESEKKVVVKRLEITGEIESVKQYVFLPKKVESCMKPGEYKLYKVVIKEDDKQLIVKDLYSLEIFKKDEKLISFEELDYDIPYPQRSRCNGDCEACKKCC